MDAPIPPLARRPAPLGGRLGRFAAETDGAMTVFGLYLFAATCALGAIALDVTHLYAARTELQVAADLGAHAALLVRESQDADAAKAAAAAAIQAGLPAERYGTVVSADAITFGTWDAEARTFAADPSSRSAVSVRTARAGTDAVSTFLFRIVGVDTMDVAASAVFTTYRPFCLQEGFVAEGVVDLQSNNGFHAGFCIHSNAHVALNQNNIFEPGTVVSMPDTSDLQIPASGFQRNEGLEAALREGQYDLRVLRRLADITSGLTSAGSPYRPSYVVNPVAVPLATLSVTPALVPAGSVYTRTCSGNQKLSIGSGTYTNMVIRTNCQVQFSNDVHLEDVVIATTSTASDSFKGPSGGNGAVSIGRSDDCAEGGGAQLITMGGVRFPAKLQMFGGQIIAQGDVQFAANANGIMGASIVAGGRIDGTSNMEMGHCGSGMEDSFAANYFRLAA